MYKTIIIQGINYLLYSWAYTAFNYFEIFGGEASQIFNKNEGYFEEKSRASLNFHVKKRSAPQKIQRNQSWFVDFRTFSRNFRVWDDKNSRISRLMVGCSYTPKAILLLNIACTSTCTRIHNKRKYRPFFKFYGFIP